MEISNNTLYNFMTEGLDRFSRANETEARQAILSEMEATLRVVNLLNGTPDRKALSSSGGVVWALDPENAAWAAAGVPAGDRATWEAFGVPPAAAGAWHKLQIPPGVACLLATNKVTPALYQLWVAFYGVDVSTPLENQSAFLNEVMEFLADTTTTPAQSKKWIDVGVPLRDIRGWKMRGQTPAGVKKQLADGVTLAGLTGDEAPVPGTSYPKVVKLADDNGWTIQPPRNNNYYYGVEMTRGNDKVAVRFSRTGRLSTFSVQGDVAVAVNATRDNTRVYNERYLYGRGIKMLEDLLTASTS